MPRAKKTPAKKTPTKSVKTTAPKKAEPTDAPERASRKPISGLPEGTQDIGNNMMPYWEVVEQAIDSLVTTYQFNKMLTPAFEARKIVEKGLGLENNITKKQLVDLKWPGGEDYVLRPELRIGMARAFILQDLTDETKPYKYYSMGPGVES